MSEKSSMLRIDSGLLVSLYGPGQEVPVDYRLHLSEDASVADLLQHLGFTEYALLVHGKPVLPDTKASELSLAHGDELRIIKSTGGTTERLGVEATRTQLVQLDGRDRGRVVSLVRGQPSYVELVRSGPHCRTLISDRRPRRRSRVSLMTVQDKGESITVSANTELSVDGEPIPVNSEARLRSGSLIQLRSQFPSADGRRWLITFQLSELSSAARGRNGWIPYRVTSEGQDPIPVLDPTDIRVPAKPEEPTRKSAVDFLFEMLPTVGIVLLMGLRGGSGLLYGAVFAAIYLIRLVWQLRKQAADQSKYEFEKKQWDTDLDSAVEKFADYVVAEHALRTAGLNGALSTEVVWRGLNRMEGLWQRGPAHRFFLHVRIGTGRWRSNEVFPVPHGLNRDEEGALHRRTNALRAIDHAPVSVDLAQHHVAIVGRASAAHQLVNLLIADLSLNHSPNDVAIFALLPAFGDDVEELSSWLKWLPHLRSEIGLLPAARIYRGQAESREFLSGLQSRLAMSQGELEGHPRVVGLIHEAVEPDLAVVESLDQLSDSKLRIVWWSSTASTVPALVDNRVLIEGFDLPTGAPATALIDSHAEGTVALPDTPNQIAEYLDADTAASRRVLLRSTKEPSALQSLARSLAPLADERKGFAASSVPALVTLDEILAADDNALDNTSGAVRTTGESLWLCLGSTGEGPLHVDLVQQGPHMLVGGTTGSGKSEFLASVIAAAVNRYDPGELQFALIDFKGGAALDVFSELTHVVCEASNLEPDRMQRALAFLEGELDARMSLLRGAAAKDFEEMRRLDSKRLPRLLVVLDEYAAAQQAFPDVRRLTDTIAARGRSLGVHVIFATQNPSTAVTADMATNIGARVCLRMLHDTDAKAVVFNPAPARIPLSLRGRAFYRSPDGHLLEFQSAFANAPVVDEMVRVQAEAFL